MDELVTIIVPVYNMHNYLERCVLSIMNQSYSALQIILIDDGSTDDSGDICDAFSGRDARIEVVHQTNGGLSAARNTGLGRARGDWIAFVDSDDYVSPYYVGDMLAVARDDCDIVVCNSAWVPNSVAIEDVPFQRHTREQLITGREACVRNFGDEAVLFNTAWGKLFRAHLWVGLSFPEGKVNEDLHVSHTLLYHARRIVITDAVLYAYVQSEGSIIRREFTTQRLDVLDAFEEGVRVFAAVGEPDLEKIARRVYCTRVFNACCVCKELIPGETEVRRQLRRRSIEAYREAKPIRGYIDFSPRKVLTYKVKLFLGRWCLPLYARLSVRGRTNI